MTLAVFTSKIRALENFDIEVAIEAAPLVQEAQRAQTRAGLTPSGEPWPAKKKDGGRALVNAANHITARPVAGTVRIDLKGVEVFHDLGVGLPKRQIIPAKGEPLPQYLLDALNEGARRAFAKRFAK